MAKRKELSYEEKMISALNKLPIPLVDKRHCLNIYFKNDRARSNQSRFDHIIDQRHGLRPSDIERIGRYIGTSKLKKDHERKETYNLYIKRNSINNEYIKISLRVEDKEPNKAYVKTIFITKIDKW